MADVTNELIYETLKQLHTEQADHRKVTDDVRSELKAVRHHVMGLVTSDLNRSASIAELELRVDRIERRLELAGNEDE